MLKFQCGYSKSMVPLDECRKQTDPIREKFKKIFELIFDKLSKRIEKIFEEGLENQR